jgi:hypothetical protein
MDTLESKILPTVVLLYQESPKMLRSHPDRSQIFIHRPRGEKCGLVLFSDMVCVERALGFAPPVENRDASIERSRSINYKMRVNSLEYPEKRSSFESILIFESCDRETRWAN